VHALPALLALVLSVPPPEPTAEQSPTPYARRAIIPLIVSGVLLAAGATFLGVSAVQTNDAQRWEGASRDALLASAGSNRVGGVMLTVTGAFSAAVAAFLFWYQPPPALSLSFTPLAGGAFVSLGWRAP
jgi:hypothetical protein